MYCPKSFSVRPSSSFRLPVILFALSLCLVGQHGLSPLHINRCPAVSRTHRHLRLIRPVSVFSKCVPFCVCVSVGGLWCSSCRETLMSPVINSLSCQRRVTGGLCGSSTRCRGSCFVKSVHCYIYKLPLCVVSPETPTIQSTKQPQTRVKGR